MNSLDNSIDKFVSKTINFFFSKEKKIQRWIICLILVGFVLRFVAALNLSVLADDVLKAFHSAGIISSKTLSTSSSPPLFYYLTDLSYKFFDYTTFASRFCSFIFGGLLIPVSFLISRKFFDRNTSLLVMFFVAFSNFLIRMTTAEESLMILFFSMVGVYFGIGYLEKEKLSLLFLSAIFFGLSCLTKYSAPFFILSFLIFSLFYLRLNEKRILTKKHLKHLVVFLLIIFLFCVPFLTFNYLLYKDKGIVDIYFSRVISLNSTQELYGSLAGQETTFFDNIFVLSNYNNIFLPFRTDIVISIFSVIGLFFLLNKKKYLPFIFVIIFFFLPFILQTGGSTLQKHFIFMSFILAFPAGFGLKSILSLINSKFIRGILFLFLIIFLSINLGNSYGTPHNFFHSSDASMLKTFINQNVLPSDLIVFDSRIYTGQTFWMATDRHFLNFHEFLDFYRNNQQLHFNGHPTNIYVIECVLDDCGWGTVSQQPDFNSSSEAILSSLKESSQLVRNIPSIDYNGNELFGQQIKKDSYRIYSTTINLDSSLISNTDYSHSFYFTPYLYKNKKLYLYTYDIYSGLDNLLQKFSYYIILLSVFLSILSVFLILYLTFRI
jgi:4-amino-4-deoxy-L-arabinose transferase-like glycosyltransferase